jgi:4-hydroxybenzoate polyprenyltransferase
MRTIWRAYFELLRFPAVFTAIADVMMGYLVTHGDLRPFRLSGLLVLSSALMYLAGMVLNDYYDAEIDAIERPNRPIPSGRVARRFAAVFGWALLAGGVSVAAFLSFLAKNYPPLWVAVALGTCIYIYDGLHHRLLVAPLLMGLCRALNVLYIVGVTLFARAEASVSSRNQLASGIVVMLIGIATLAHGASHVGNPSPYRWIVWLAVGLYVAVRHALALVSGESHAVQRSVRLALRMLIFLDFLVAFEAAPHSSGSMLILLLYVPMLILEYWFSTT